MKSVLITPKKDTVISVIESTQYVLLLENPLKENIYHLEISLQKKGVEAQIIGIYSLKSGEHLNLTTVARHQVPHTSCMTEIKGVLGDGSSSDYVGKILIEKDAQQTSSFLEDSVLVIGENTKNNSQPILEIEADDVKASHGATTGRVSDIDFYYLKSRGLSESEAKELIVGGFFESLLSKIIDDKVRDKVREKILSRIEF